MEKDVLRLEIRDEDEDGNPVVRHVEISLIDPELTPAPEVIDPAQREFCARVRPVVFVTDRWR